MNKYFSIIPTFLKDPEAFYASVQRNEDLRLKTVALLISSGVFIVIYGFVTGLSHSWLQALSTGIKMPLLFLLTLAFTLPALYFFALALLNIQFSVIQAGVVFLSGIGVTAFLLLGLSPVTLFFVLTSSNYPFFQLLAVLFVAISGFVGLHYILKGFTWVDRDQELAGGTVGNLLLRAWIILYGFVGAQMTWRLSPFIGNPQDPFSIIRPSRDNFFIDVLNAIKQTFGITTTEFMPFYEGTFLCTGVLVIMVLAIGGWLGSRRKLAGAKSHKQVVKELERITTNNKDSTPSQE
ncbi:MAG: hypothetical protein JXA42_10435 [Anaerolineales bacterium]|nr:hypothetical protein [Anaerolineales bacterium]